MPDLLVEHVCKSYPTRGEPLHVLQDVSFSLSAGQNLAVLGPSGCGKSTLLHILGTLEAPTSGNVLLHGQNPFASNEADLARFRNRHIGFVFQDHHLLPQLSVLENVLTPALAQGSPGAEVVARARRLLEQVGLEERLDHRPAELSGGERGRAAVARALLLEPTLLLADEPTGNLDRASAAVVAQLLLDLQRQEKAMLVVVTHSLELADRLERRCTLVDGRLEKLP